MHSRSVELQNFLTTMCASIMDRAAAGSAAALTATRLFGALQTPSGMADTTATRLPLCDLLDEVIDDLLSATETHETPEPALSNVVAHARALKALSAHLSWHRRPGAEVQGEPFFSGHANATVIGTGGLEERDDIWIGVSLLAPAIVYPEHRHPPEEVYVVLSPGQWQQNGGAWHEPGIGGIVHNPPGILHSMRSGSSPLLASWCLWAG